MKQPQNIEWDFFGRGPPKAPGLYAVAWMGGTQRGAAFDVPVYGVRVRGTEGWPAHLIAFAGPFGSEEDAEIWINEVGDWEHPR